LSGEFSVGQLLVVHASNLLSDVAFSYQWLRDGIPVIGGTEKTFQVTSNDFQHSLSVEVIASKAGYESVVSISSASLVSSGRLSQSSRPTILKNQSTEDNLGIDLGSWDSGATFSYQWLRGGVAIPAATSSSYTLQPSDYLKRISVAVTGSKEGYESKTMTSAEVTPIKESDRISALKFGGAFQVGKSASVSPAKQNKRKFEYTYQWLRNDQPIESAQSRNYTFGPDDVGTTISAKVCLVLRGEQLDCLIKEVPSSVKLGTMAKIKSGYSGTLKVGRLLTVNSVATMPEASVSYQWFKNGQAIAGATENTYLVQLADKRSRLSVAVTVSKTGYETQTKRSTDKLID
jgi:hypothetical protein